jgi:hypothetical protein
MFAIISVFELHGTHGQPEAAPLAGNKIAAGVNENKQLMKKSLTEKMV